MALRPRDRIGSAYEVLNHPIPGRTPYQQDFGLVGDPQSDELARLRQVSMLLADYFKSFPYLSEKSLFKLHSHKPR
jgi:hypothetical protein